MCYHGNTGDIVDHRGRYTDSMVYLKKTFGFYKKNLELGKQEDVNSNKEQL
jgi:hypothetical protein